LWVINMFFILFQLSNKHDPEAAAVVFQKKSKKSRTQRWKVHKTNKILLPQIKRSCGLRKLA
jgi:hypothetical protein